MKATCLRNFVPAVGALCLGLLIPVGAYGADSPLAEGRGKPSIRLTLTPTLPLNTNITGEIAGMVTGVSPFSDYRVVIYAKGGDTWYPQPFTDRLLTDIGDDGTFSVDVHGGTAYVALLVKKTYIPSDKKLTAIPPVRGDVLAKTPQEPPGKKPQDSQK